MKRAITLILLASMLLSAFSCGNNENGENTEASSDSSASNSDSGTKAADTPDFERSDFGGEKFTILAFELPFYDEYFFAEEANGDRMNDAIYERELMTEDYLGVEIENYIVPTHRDLASTVQQTVAAGDDSFQLALPHCIRGVSDMLTSGSLYDWNELPYIDFSKDYYNRNFNDALSLGDKQYYAVSDYMIANPCCILFNKDMITDFGMEDPYKLVYDGTWTFDKMYEMAEKATVDINGDSTMDVNDQYGITGLGNWILNCIPYACDIFLADKNDDGFELAYYSEKTIDIIEKFNKALNNDQSIYIWSYAYVNDKSVQINMDSGRSLFQWYPLYQIYDFRDSDVDFGILPFPKYDEAQDNYYTNDWGSLMCIPASIKNPEMVAKVIDYMSYISQKTTIPAYYDVTLVGKLSRDDDSAAMMDIIFDNIVYDAGMNYFGFGTNMMKLFYTLEELVCINNSTDFASWYEQYAEGAQAEIDSFMNMMSE